MPMEYMNRYTEQWNVESIYSPYFPEAVLSSQESTNKQDPASICDYTDQRFELKYELLQ